MKKILLYALLIPMFVIANIGISMAADAPELQPGPSEKQVRDDWDGYVKTLGGCLPDVKITDVKVVGTSVESNSAEVILQISGEWISKQDPGYMGGPCWKFSRSRGATQTVERHFTYKKFDMGWRLKGTDDPMAAYFRYPR